MRIAICDDEAAQRRCLQALVDERVAPRTILFQKGDGHLRVAAKDIYYAEAFSHSVTLY